MDGLELRSYQSSAIHAVFEAWRYGARSVLLVAPTGCGKRCLALWLMDYAEKAGRRVLFVGNRRLLVTQAENDARKYGLGYGVIMADNDGGDSGSSNQFASIHTLESRHFYETYTNDLTGVGLPGADLVICDEAHSDTGRYRQLFSLYLEAKILGLTATPVGAQGRSLVPSPYDQLVEPIKNTELIRDGFLLPTTCYAPSEPHLQGVQIENGKEYNQNALGRAVQSCTVFADVFREWESHQDRATVCFVPGIAFGRDLVAQFNRRLGGTNDRPQAYLIEAKTKPHERQRAFAAVEEGSCRTLVSCDVLREGFDLPLLSCGIDLQPNSQLRSYWQKIGRIKRPFGGQSNAVWLDFAGNYWRFPHPDEDPEWPSGQETTQEAIERSRTAKKDSQPIACHKCGYVRQRGSQCPNCGHVSGEAFRRIRMGDGRLELVPARQHKAHQITEAERMYNKWKSRLFAALHTGHSYSQAAHLFKKETGEYPSPKWPLVMQGLDGKRKVRDEFTKSQLNAALHRHKEESNG